jgi:hypothetical protein
MVIHHARARSRVSPLHAKGILTLGLVLIAESVTVSNAVKFGNEQGFGGNSRRVVQDCIPSSSDGGQTCSNNSPSLPPIRRTLGRLTKRLSFGKADCCTDCTHCLDVSCPSIPRGGHIERAAEAAVDAAKAVMPYGIPLNGWKVIFQAFLTTLNVLCWLIPLRSKKISENKLALSLANAFSGGVFLSLAFGHLIPECVHGFEGYNYNEVTPYLLVLSGYLLIFFVEKVAFDAHGALHEMEHAQDHTNQKVNGDDSNNNTQANSNSGRSALILLAALAVHSILEMTALGLADTFGDSAILTLSIALHQVSRKMSCQKRGWHIWFHITVNVFAHTGTLPFPLARAACRIHCSLGRVFEIWNAKGRNRSIFVSL